MSPEERVKAILLEILDVDEKDIVPEAHLINDLSATSVDLVEIVAGIENEFDVDISDDEAPKMRTVQAIIDYLQARLS